MNTNVEAPVGHLTLEDLSVGQVFRSGTYQINADDIIQFASKYDPQPFHTNEDKAETSFFNGLAASGWHTAAIAMRLIVLSTPILGGLIGAGADISWPRPTRPGDILHVETEVLELKPSKSKPDRGIVTVRSTTKNQNGETVQICTSRLVVPRKTT